VGENVQAESTLPLRRTADGTERCRAALLAATTVAASCSRTLSIAFLSRRTLSFGIAIPARVPIMTTTIISSAVEKPSREGGRRHVIAIPGERHVSPQCRRGSRRHHAGRPSNGRPRGRAGHAPETCLSILSDTRHSHDRQLSRPVHGRLATGSTSRNWLRKEWCAIFNKRPAILARFPPPSVEGPPDPYRPFMSDSTSQ